MRILWVQRNELHLSRASCPCSGDINGRIKSLCVWGAETRKGNLLVKLEEEEELTVRQAAKCLSHFVRFDGPKRWQAARSRSCGKTNKLLCFGLRTCCVQRQSINAKWLPHSFAHGCCSKQAVCILVQRGLKRRWILFACIGQGGILSAKGKTVFDSDGYRLCCFQIFNYCCHELHCLCVTLPTVLTAQIKKKKKCFHRDFCSLFALMRHLQPR